MPGIITHNRIFLETINFLKKDKQRNVYSKSIEILFKSTAFFKAGLFGAIGPNIFDYLPFFRTNYICGSGISYSLHTSKCEEFLKSIINILSSYKNQNTEWASVQRAYLYGLISHLISDSVFHPFIYYWSGFTNSKKKNELSYFREQHLIFEYNMDLFFSNVDNENTYSAKYTFNLNDMLPVTKKERFMKIERAIIELLAKEIEKSYPKMFNNVLIRKFNNKKLLIFIIINMIPYFIKFSYKLKRSRNQELINIFEYIKKKNLFYSDYLVNYPAPGKINTHVLNLHKERWFHPTGATGLHYESVKDLLLSACSKTADIWKKTENFLLGNNKDFNLIGNELKLNSITGIVEKEFTSLQIQNPVRFKI